MNDNSTEHPERYEWPSNRQEDKVIEKRWWMWEWGAEAGARQSAVQDCEGDDDSVTSTEVRVVPLSAVVLEEGSYGWAMEMGRRGHRIAHNLAAPVRNWKEYLSFPFEATLAFANDWYLLPAPWVPKKDDRVRWTRGKDSGTATYHKPYNEKPEGHYVFIDGVTVPLWVETVSKLEGTP